MNISLSKNLYSGINILKRLITRNRQPWMRWVEHKLTRVAQNWEVAEAMAATPTKKQLKTLDSTCLVESTLALWHEIGGTNLGDRMVTNTLPDNTTTTTWESGFGAHHHDIWHPLENLKTSTIYDILLENRTKLRNYTPKIAHKHIHLIKHYLTPEERHFWWKLIHKLTSIKTIESKYKRDDNNNLVSAACPMCPTQDETRLHYEYDCPQLSQFRQQVAHLFRRKDFTHREWMLEDKQPLEAMIFIAKARWAFHCERCKITHKSRRRFHLKVVLDRTQRRMQLITDIYEKDTDPPHT